MLRTRDAAYGSGGSGRLADGILLWSEVEGVIARGGFSVGHVKGGGFAGDALGSDWTVEVVRTAGDYGRRREHVGACGRSGACGV